MKNLHNLPGYVTIKTFEYKGFDVSLKASRHYDVHFNTHTQFCKDMQEVDEAIERYQDELFADFLAA